MFLLAVYEIPLFSLRQPPQFVFFGVETLHNKALKCRVQTPLSVYMCAIVEEKVTKQLAHRLVAL